MLLTTWGLSSPEGWLKVGTTCGKAQLMLRCFPPPTHRELRLLKCTLLDPSCWCFTQGIVIHVQVSLLLGLLLEQASPRPRRNQSCVFLWIRSGTVLLGRRNLTEPAMLIVPLSPSQNPQKYKVAFSFFFFFFFLILTNFPCFTTRWESETGLTQPLPSLSQQEFRGELGIEKYTQVNSLVPGAELKTHPAHFLTSGMEWVNPKNVFWAVLWVNPKSAWLWQHRCLRVPVAAPLPSCEEESGTQRQDGGEILGEKYFTFAPVLEHGVVTKALVIHSLYPCPRESNEPPKLRREAQNKAAFSPPFLLHPFPTGLLCNDARSDTIFLQRLKMCWCNDCR
eukprot:XP_027328765.1 uncharacterized protein LOC110354362 [Anas platyrhynchos]